MPNRHTEDIRHESQRGLLLVILIARGLEWVPYSEARKQMARLGYPMDDEELNFHLNYLEAGGYLERKLLRSGKADFELTLMRATKKAVDLHDGRIGEDPGVAF